MKRWGREIYMRGERRPRKSTETGKEWLTAQMMAVLAVFALWRTYEYFGGESPFYWVRDKPGDVDCARPILGVHYFGDFFSVWCQQQLGPYGEHQPPASQTPLLYAVHRIPLVNDGTTTLVFLFVLISATLCFLAYRRTASLTTVLLVFISSPVLIALDRGNLGWLLVLASLLSFDAGKSRVETQVAAAAFVLALKPLAWPFFLFLWIRDARTSPLKPIVLSVLGAIPLTLLAMFYLDWPISSLGELAKVYKAGGGTAYDNPLTELPLVAIYKLLENSGLHTPVLDVSFLAVVALSIAAGILYVTARGRGLGSHKSCLKAPTALPTAVVLLFVPNTYGWIVLLPLLIAAEQDPHRKHLVYLVAPACMLGPFVTLLFARHMPENTSAPTILLVSTLLVLEMSDTRKVCDETTPKEPLSR